MKHLTNIFLILSFICFGCSNNKRAISEKPLWEEFYYLNKENNKARVLLIHNHRSVDISFVNNNGCINDIFAIMIPIKNKSIAAYQLVDIATIDHEVIDTLIFSRSKNKCYLKSNNLTFFKIKKVDTSFTNKIFPYTKKIIISPHSGDSGSN